ncbi:hypothetical protein K7C20_04040 [Streptomyces decoyicus]|uniref:hypothetical protein n=1 Tax=Streptomyces decoyicus TaxID=249567 RepID=UPI0004AA1CF0|nr:hypothetical protein [Streptomyces decoyicus]QZY14522.1 hypothetical protein K7C20_04040 [Streptomyces decoyicus]
MTGRRAGHLTELYDRKELEGRLGTARFGLALDVTDHAAGVRLVTRFAIRPGVAGTSVGQAPIAAACPPYPGPVPPWMRRDGGPRGRHRRALANPKIDEREAPASMLGCEPYLATDRPGPLVIVDKGCASKEFENDLATRGAELLRPPLKREKHRKDESLL